MYIMYKNLPVMALYWLLDTAHNLPLQNLAAASGNVLEYKGNVALQSMLLSVYEGESILLRLRAGISYRDGTILQKKTTSSWPNHTKPSNRQHHICQNWHLLEPPKPRQFTRSGKACPAGLQHTAPWPSGMTRISMAPAASTGRTIALARAGLRC